MSLEKTSIAKKELERMKKIQELFLEFLEEEMNAEENYQNLIALFDEQKTHDDRHKITLFLNLLTKISNNCHRGPTFFSKIEKIILIFKDDIKKYMSNLEIFDTFKSNKRILLFLIEEKMMFFDKYIIDKIVTKKYIRAKYPQYFQPEIKLFVDEKWFAKKEEDLFDYSFQDFWLDDIQQELPENFYELRKEGENESEICKLIRKDQIKEFITYVNQKSIPLTSTITPSKYETNHYLIEKTASYNDKMNYHHSKKNFNNDECKKNIFNPEKNIFIQKNNEFYNRNPRLRFNQNFQKNLQNKETVSLIEYATFFGSIQIFNFLRSNNIELTPSLWAYSVHGKNPEIIHVLEENNIEYNIPDLIKESIKCHHNEILNYFLYNYCKSDNGTFSTFLDLHTKSLLKFYNFSFLDERKISTSNFGYLFKYNYFTFCEDLLKNYVICDENGAFDLFYHSVVVNENAEMLKLLISYSKIDINQPNREYPFRNHTENYLAEKTALHIAVENDNIDIVKLLLSYDEIDVNIYSQTKSEVVCSGSDSDDEERNDNCVQKTALIAAIKNNNIEIVKLLLSNDKINVNLGSIHEFDYVKWKQITPLFLATKNGYIEIVKLLLSKSDIDVNAINITRNQKITGLQTNDDSDDSDVEGHCYRSNQSSLMEERQTALYSAVLNGYDDIIELLLENQNIDPNVYCLMFKVNNIITPSLPSFMNNDEFTDQFIPQSTKSYNSFRSLNLFHKLNPSFQFPDFNLLNSFPMKNIINIFPISFILESSPTTIPMFLSYTPPPKKSLHEANPMSSLTSMNPTIILPTAQIPPINSLSTMNPTHFLPTNSLPPMNPTDFSSATPLPTMNPMNTLPTTPLPPMNSLSPMNPTNVLPTTLIPPINSLSTMNPTNFLPTAPLLPMNPLSTMNPINSLPSIGLMDQFIMMNPMNLLQDESQSLDECAKTVLHLAISKCNIKCIKLLLSNDKIDVNCNCISNLDEEIFSKTALYMAIEHNNAEIVELLLSHPDINTNLMNITSYLWFKYKSEDISKFFIYNKTALYLAVEKNNAEIVKLLMSNNDIDPNIISEMYENDIIFHKRKENKRTALHEAIKSGNMDIVQCLLENNKTDLNVKDEKDRTANDYKDKYKQTIHLFD